MSERLRGALRVGRSGRRGAGPARWTATGCGVGAGAGSGSATTIGMSDVSSPTGGRSSSVSPCAAAEGGSAGLGLPAASATGGSGSGLRLRGDGGGLGSGSACGLGSARGSGSGPALPRRCRRRLPTAPRSCCGSGSCVGAVSGGGSSTTAVERIDGSAAGATAGPPKLSDPSAEPLSAARSASIDSIALLSAARRRAASARTVSFALAKRSGARICVLRR